MNTKLSVEQRFWKKVSKTENGCWLWTAATNGHGYGIFRISIKEKNKIAHRYSFELANGSIPIGMIICHSCDTPGCVNPKHLFLGTHKDNAIDRSKKGRTKCFKKLSNDNVKIIKSSTLSQSKLSKQFGVSRRTIASIQYGETWIDVESTAISNKTFTCQICNKPASHTIHKDTNYQYRKISDELCLYCDRALKLFGSDIAKLTAAIKFLTK